ncbi:hypothetical protein EC957_012011 [Mortierella hygrophila]|uniref:Protein kinase domain-containing protein n=1 Tax=Mortierella hygrophila TaxID=979708 RepID=A0A9P6FGG8_9FUNG|nr:hypothetical protein EC957_012011 [Mortierella hygrophila]
MHLLNTAKLLHENPYTGDRITKACIVHLEPSLLRDTLKLQQQQQAYDNNTNEEDIFSAFGLTHDNSDGLVNGAAETRQRGPELVAIKFLSSSTSYADGFDSSSDDDEADDGDEDDCSDIALRQRPLAHGWTAVGLTDVPQKVKFGLKAKREIAALRAAQGHPNVVPFLGFTGHKKPNVFHKARRQEEDSSPAHLGISPGPLGGPLFVSASPLGSSLFQSDAGGIPTSTLTLLQPSSTSILEDGPQNLFAPFRQSSGWDSDEYDSDTSENVHEIDPNSSTETKLHHFHRIFSRQPGPGGIILPLVHNSLQDLIQIGWTKTRPFMVETCMRQILEGLAWIHDEAGLIHRDISAGNILVTIAPGGYRDEQMGVVQDRKDGKGCGVVQCLISDFGCATFHSASETTAETVPHDEEAAVDEDDQHNHYRPQQRQQQGLTFEVGTRAYRAPELLFSSGKYTNAIDIWSAGVLFAEMYLGKHLFEAESDIGQVCAIVKVLGTPTEDNWPEYRTMPDYGKLIFQALEVNDLSSILLGSSPPSLDEKENDTSDSLATHDDDNDREEETAPPTLISEASLRLIEHMVTFSGATRPSARQALSELPSLSGLSMDENGESRYGELLKECILDVQQVLDELQRFKAREADESDDDGEGGGGMFMFGSGGGGHGADGAHWRNAEFEEGSDDDNDGQRSIRSDDFSRYDFQSATTAAIGHDDKQGQGQSRQFGREFDGYDGHGHEFVSSMSVSVSEHGEGEVGAGGIEEEKDGGPVRAVKRHRGVSEGDNSFDSQQASG